MKILIADDEALARARLAALLAAHATDYEVAGEAASGAEVLAWCRDGTVDLILLDIRMPGMDGIETALRLAEQPQAPAVVFVTAYDQHALAAFDANAIDYLLKPVRPDRLVRALRKARALSAEQADGLAASSGYLAVSYRGEIRRVPVADVILLRAASKYVEVFHTTGSGLTEESLRSIEERLPGRFLRVHRNALVAPDKARGLRREDAGRLVVELQDCDETPEVSRRHAPEVRRLLRGSK